MSDTGPHKRRSFPDDERKHPWLPLLLDAYALVDEGVAAAVEREERRTGRRLACRRGCDSCCRTQRDIPVYAHEVTGIYWYCTERIRPPTRGVLSHRLAARTPEQACPFLMDGACVIHPVRPAGCRQFNVLGEACADGEDPFHSRREDVVAPPREVLHRAFGLVLPLYGKEVLKARRKETVEKIIHTQALRLPGLDWRRLASRMSEYDARQVRTEAGR